MKTCIFRMSLHIQKANTAFQLSFIVIYQVLLCIHFECNCPIQTQKEGNIHVSCNILSIQPDPSRKLIQNLIGKMDTHCDDGKQS